MLNDLADGAWLIAEHAMSTVHRLAREPVGAWVDARRLAQEIAAHDPAPEPADGACGTDALTGSASSPAAGVAVVPLQGIITPSPSLFSLIFGGGGGLQLFRAQLREAVNDDRVTAIVLNVNSPGGRVDLVQEVAAEVRAAREAKPVIAVANTLAASAAYWIISGADEIVVTPSGRVGSIGVYSVHDDYSGMWEQAGIAVTYISAGEFKVERNPDQPLSQAALEAWQEEITAIYDSFVADVARGRGVSTAAVRSSYGKGRCVLAADAKKAGMVDRVATLEETISRVARGRGVGRRTRAEYDTPAPAAADVELAQPDATAAEPSGADDVVERDAPSAADGNPTPPLAEEAESYGLDTRRRRLALVEHRLG